MGKLDESVYGEIAMFSSMMYLDSAIKEAVNKRDFENDKFFDNGRLLSPTNISLDLANVYTHNMSAIARSNGEEFKKGHVMFNVHTLGMNAAKAFFNNAYPNTKDLDPGMVAVELARAYEESVNTITNKYQVYLDQEKLEEAQKTETQPIEYQPNPFS